MGRHGRVWGPSRPKGDAVCPRDPLPRQEIALCWSRSECCFSSPEKALALSLTTTTHAPSAASLSLHGLLHHVQQNNSLIACCVVVRLYSYPLYYHDYHCETTQYCTIRSFDLSLGHSNVIITRNRMLQHS